ncbi:MAG: YbaK/EbsC family protein [Planctomycetes bacterium]|nr:YbaK/EbsC family protein [Planctomycetota bacterium]
MNVIEFLDETRAKYEVTQHRPTFTAQQMAAEEHVPGMQVAKPVLIRVEEENYLCVLPACCKVDLDALKGQLGVDDVELADESEMAKLFPDVALGAEPPFGEMYGLLTFMDRSLEGCEHIVFQGGSHDTAIRMEVADYKRLANPRIFSFSYHI